MTRFAIKAAVLAAMFICSPRTASAFYDPGMQRWPNQDPLENEGFQVLLFSSSGSRFSRLYSLSGLLLDPNLYTFNDNDPEDDYDALGLSPSSPSGPSGGTNNPPSKPAPPCDPNPCPGFESKWKDPPKWFPKKFACGTAKSACDAGCYDYEGDANCALKCAQDCTANLWKCIYGIAKGPGPKK